MGYNIRDAGAETTLSGGNWVATLDLSLSNATTVTGDFDEYVFGFPNGTQDTVFSFSGLSDPTFGSVVGNADGTYVFTVDWSAVQDTELDQVVSFTVTGNDSAGSETDTVVINLLICVARGTMIETNNGPVAVENLKIGDNVVTMDGGAQPLLWSGSRKIGRVELDADPSKRPIRFEPGALGAGRPDQTLCVSPQHRMYLQDWRAQLMFGDDEVLVPAKSLINDLTIRQDSETEEVEYFHLLFDEHQIIFTNGAPTESFHPGAYTLSELDDQVRRELFDLFPELETGCGYGASARTVLRPWEASILVERDCPAELA